MPQFLLPVLAFATTWGILVLTPGTETALVIRLGISVGRTTATGAVLGIATGLTLWGFGTAFGLSALISTSRPLFLGLEWACAGYLLYLAVRLFINVLKAHPQQAEAHGGYTPQAFWSGFQRGALTTVLNPLVGVFDLTAFPQFIPPGVSVLSYSFLLLIVQVILTLLWYFTLVIMAVSLSRFLARPAIIRILDALTGLVFVFFAVRLLLNP